MGAMILGLVVWNVINRGDKFVVFCVDRFVYYLHIDFQLWHQLGKYGLKVQEVGQVMNLALEKGRERYIKTEKMGRMKRNQVFWQCLSRCLQPYLS